MIRIAESGPEATGEPLTMEEAEAISGGKIQVMPDDIEPSIWWICMTENPLCGVALAPLTRSQLEELLDEWFE